MVNSVENVVSGKALATGGAYVGDMTASVPTGAETVLEGYDSFGYVSEDGLTEGNDRSTSKIKAWGGDVVKIVQDEHSVTYKLALIESTNATVLKAVYGDENVTVTPATEATPAVVKVNVTSAVLPHKRWAFEIKDGDARIRISVPDGQVTETGEITYTDGDIIKYDITIEAFADAEGVKATKWISNGRKLAAVVGG